MQISEESKWKPKSFSVHSIIKKSDKMIFNREHSQQREFIWKTLQESNLISDILQGNHLPDLIFAEQIINDATIIWVIEGKQRCTTMIEFFNNKFKISPKVTRYMIKYSEPIRDEDGVCVRDEDDNVIYEQKEFDIRKKSFKDLPDTLKDKFLDYTFGTVYYCNCTDEEIAYHIQRYNSGKPMNVAQKGITFIGKRNSDAIRNVLSMPFFVDGIGNYTETQFKNSTVSRVVAESIMTMRYLNNWNKSYDDNAKFLEKNAVADDFEYFRGILTEFEEELDYSVGKMFDDVDSFIWFGLYSKFEKIGLSCEDFNTFMCEINKGVVRNRKGKIDKNESMSGICVKEIDNNTLEKLWQNSSTKDKSVVKARIDFLTKLACDYFGVEMPVDEVEESVVEEDTSESVETAETTATTSHTPSIFAEETTDEYDDIEIHNDELEDFATEFADNNTAIESLILTTKGHNIADFTQESLSEMIEWYEDNGNKKMLDDCLGYKSYLEDADIDNNDRNVPFYVWAAKYAFERMDEDIDIDVDIAEWLNEMSQTAFREIDSADNYKFEEAKTVVEKKQEIINHFNKYIREDISYEII